jgi:protease-4
VDDFYATARQDVCASRGFSPEKFDELIDRDFVFMPADAVESGLADTLGRWESAEKIAESMEGRRISFVRARALDHYQLPRDDYWGERPKIAIVYALGECAMDSGIKARKLVKDIESVTEDKEIRAVVFRVDSPGGSGLASDIVAEALKKCRERKPVIVTQGLVAGSGGYWISMYGDTIVAAPGTITGSIGVIGFWLYNKELKEKLGVATDMVKVGEHADLGFGFNFPLLGTLPDRNLTAEERARMEKLIRSMYREFVGKVATGRGMKQEEIEVVAQGRIWSGIDGLNNGLVDILGGLETAVLIAKEKAGIPKDAEVTIVELPRLELLPPNMFQPKLAGMNADDLEFKKYLDFLAQHNGKFLPILPLEEIMTINGMREAK